MVSELSWREHLSQEKEKRHCCHTWKLGLFIEEGFQPQIHLERCTLPQGTFWHLQRTFSVARSPGKWNPSFHKVLEVLENQSTRSTRKLEAPVQKSADQVWRGKIWIFRNLTVPAYSPQSSTSFGEFNFQIQEIWFFYYFYSPEG